MTVTLRPYQLDAVDRTRELLNAGTDRVIVVAPTGAGKTIIATDLVSRVLAVGGRALFGAHRIELIDQISAKLDAIGIDHGVIQGSHPRVRPWCPIQVASVPTLARRPRLPDADVLFVDECHHSTATTFADLLRAYQHAKVIGLTATPYRTDGRGLGEHYQAIVEVASIAELIAQGYLVPPRVFAPSAPDLRGVHSVGGDFNRKELAERANKPTLIGNVVETWQKLAAGRPTILFAVDVAHSKALVERFRAAGIAAEHVDADTHEHERKGALARLANGTTTVISNCGLFTEGWDAPWVSCVVLARPTQSRSLYRQMVGRGLRTYGSKVDCLVLDHAGNTSRHGFVTEPETYSLLGEERSSKRNDAVPSVRICKSCYAVSPGTALKCTFCGREFPLKKKIVIERAGELREAHDSWADRVPPEQRAKTLASWIREAREKGHNPMAPYAKFRGTFKVPVDPDTRRAAEAMVGGGA